MMSRARTELSRQETADLDELPRRLMRSFLRWKSALETNLEAEGLSDTIAPGAGMVLFALYEKDGRTIGEFARRSRVSHVAVVHVIKRLERSGLVMRRACPNDGRRSRVWLTQQGRRLEPNMRHLHERNLDVLVSALGAEKAAALAALLQDLIEGLDLPVDEGDTLSVSSSKSNPKP